MNPLPLGAALDALIAEMRERSSELYEQGISLELDAWADRLAALRAASEPKTADVSPSELSRALTDARLAVNDWHPCATHEELGRWREAQQRLIDAAKACGVAEQAMADRALRAALAQEPTLPMLALQLGWGTMTPSEAYNFLWEREQLLRLAQAELETEKSDSSTPAQAIRDRIQKLRAGGSPEPDPPALT